MSDAQVFSPEVTRRIERVMLRILTQKYGGRWVARTIDERGADGASVKPLTPEPLA